MTTEQPKKVWYKRKAFLAAIVAAVGVALDIGVGEQSAIVEVLVLIAGVL